jgi:2-polyprenyl-6-methoxyphenol hydroxylase-like FAD-dependent oxidoreductase
MELQTDVLIVGGGPSGLATAIELGTRGIRVLLVERNERAGTAPRAKTTNVRTRTHLRRWGIAERLAQEAPFGIDYPNNMVFVTSLAGFELARFANAFNAAPERDPRYPEHAQWVPQYTLEKVLLDKARSLPSVEVRFNTRCIAATQDKDSVSATITDAGGDTTVKARYLVGADGARSAVREAIGATMQGGAGWPMPITSSSALPIWPGRMPMARQPSTGRSARTASAPWGRWTATTHGSSPPPVYPKARRSRPRLPPR